MVACIAVASPDPSGQVATCGVVWRLVDHADADGGGHAATNGSDGIGSAVGIGALLGAAGGVLIAMARRRRLI